MCTRRPPNTALRSCGAFLAEIDRVGYCGQIDEGLSVAGKINKIVFEFRGPTSTPDLPSVVDPIDEAVKRLARIIGRQMARDQFRKPDTALEQSPAESE
jgi:hypothetical protein